MSKRAIRHIVCVSDLHIGSSVALCPPEFRLDDGGLYRFSRFQSVLWKWWGEFWHTWVPSVTHKEPFAIVINGDLLEGRHHDSTTVLSSNLADQARCAVAVLTPLTKLTGTVYVVRGTEAHAGKTGQDEEDVASRIGATGRNGTSSVWELWCELGGRLIHFSHHIGTTSSAAYESSALMREAVAAFVESGQWGERFPQLVVRSHRHRYGRVAVPTMDGDCEVVTTPGWQLHTPFTHRGMSMRLPQIGGLCITAEPSGLVVRSKLWAPKRGAPVRL